MRVALLSANAQVGDAIGNQLAEKLAFFLDRGADVAVFLESDNRLHPSIRPHCRILTAREPHGDDWDFLSSADLLIVEYGHYYPLLELLPMLAGDKPRILFDYHGVTPLDLWGPYHGEALQQGLRQRGLVWCADAAVTHSRFTCRELVEHSGFPAERVHRLGHVIDTERYCPGIPRQSWRAELGLHTETLLLFVGRLAPNKRLPILVEALGQLRERSPAVHALVVGDNSDVYQTEAQRCQQRAAELGVADRLHFLGHVTEDRLLDAYRSADVFVMPSRHEGFCIPLLEAMACGLPVVAARAGALPETVGDAGLTFIPDDVSDLVRQLLRVLTSAELEQPASPRHPVTPSPRHPVSVAVVAGRYGTDFVGGAETSLRTIAEALQQAGHGVEVFTTCTKGENDWADQCAEGTRTINGIPVQSFRVDPHDHERHLASVAAIVHAHGAVPEAAEREYLEHSLHSSRLLAALRQRIDQFDAVIVGPYLFGLTFDVAREFPDKTLLLPCFHDEPFARLRCLRDTYERVGGILYHSPEEQELAEIDLGLNQPGAVRVGTVLEDSQPGDPQQDQERSGGARRYLVYCGRYSPQKNLPTLLEYARRYHEQQPDRFTFVFMGQGDLSIPREPWACDLGFVSPQVKRDVLARAAALMQLSHYESLSLAALEAWAQGVPVIADAACAVLAGHLRRNQAGRAVDGYDAFAAALDDLWDHPERWADLGRNGREYVRCRYQSRAAFTKTVVDAIHDLRTPLTERMKRRSRGRPAEHGRPAWRARFSRLIEDVLHAPTRSYREHVEVRPRGATRTVSAGLGTMLVPVQVVNHGTHAVAHEGPARMVLRCQVQDATGQPCGPPAPATPLPALLLPGRSLAAAVAVPVPSVPGNYTMAFRVERASPPDPDDKPQAKEARLPLIVEAADCSVPAGCCVPQLEAVQGAVVRAHELQRLPSDYVDVTEGWFATCKRWLKRKLLGNFKRAYVDVLSRQQSAFNQEVLRALHELAECCATLDHAHSLERGADSGSLAPIRATLQNLTERLLRLEANPIDGFRGAAEEPTASEWKELVS